MGEGLDCAGVVEDEDEVGELEADLAAEAGAGCGDRGGGGPGTVMEAGDNEAAAETGGAEEAGFDYCEDCEALERRGATKAVVFG